MDAPDVDPKTLKKALNFIRRINALLGYARVTVQHLDRLTSSVPAGRAITILDVATGSGDIPQAILRWADHKSLDVQITAIDLHEATLQTAHQFNHDERLRFARGDATQLPFEKDAFDFVLTSMFLHHLDEEQVIRVLKEMDRVARHGIIAADLLRSRRAYGWITLLTLFAQPMVRHDARVSVAGAFTRDELRTLIASAGLKYLHPYKHFGHRIVFAGKKT